MTGSSPQPIRVLLVDDHTMVRRGLVTFLKVFDDLQLAVDHVHLHWPQQKIQVPPTKPPARDLRQCARSEVRHQVRRSHPWFP